MVMELREAGDKLRLRQRGTGDQTEGRDERAHGKRWEEWSLGKRAG